MPWVDYSILLETLYLTYSILLFEARKLFEQQYSELEPFSTSFLVPLPQFNFMKLILVNGLLIEQTDAKN